MKLLATSDLHVSYQDNRQVTDAIVSADQEDWLIIAGDVGEKFTDVEWTLRTLRPRFGQVVWTPGNHELWTIDMAARRVVSRVPVPSRPRMQIRASSSGQLLYFYEAGRLIEVYTADASKKLRTITLDSDMMYGTFVIVSANDAGTTTR